MTTAKQKPMSLSAYGKRRGVTHEAVRRAIQSGRLQDSIVIVKGRPKIADVELADKEWSERTRSKQPAPPPPTGPDSEISFAEARRRTQIEVWRRTQIQRERDQIDLDRTSAKLVEISEVLDEVGKHYHTCRNKLLGLATRCRQRMPHLALEDVRLIDSLVREALEDLAEGRVVDRAQRAAEKYGA